MSVSFDMKLKSNVKDSINRELDKLTRNTYFDMIPLEKIEDILKKYYIVMVNEDGTEWSGFLTGREGRTTFELADINNTNDKKFYYPLKNTMLVLTWYQVDSGRYEIVSYVS